jgi:Arc/MetJ family transcription regulator
MLYRVVKCPENRIDEQLLGQGLRATRIEPERAAVEAGLRMLLHDLSANGSRDMGHSRSAKATIDLTRFRHTGGSPVRPGPKLKFKIS